MLPTEFHLLLTKSTQITWFSSNVIGIVILIFNNHSTLYLYSVLNSKSPLSLLLYFITNIYNITIRLMCKN